MPPLKDLIGQKYGKLTVIKRAPNKGKTVMWKCQCECGTIKNIAGNSLRRGVTKTCGCERIKDLSGNRYGMVTVINASDKRSSNGIVYWNCRCDCGKEFLALSNNLQRNHHLSCGCQPKIKDITNQRFGKLVAVYPTEKRTAGRRVIWHCLCDCGNECDIAADSLINGNTKSCGCLKNLVGKTFGKLSVLSATLQRTSSGGVIYRCKCECGNICEKSENDLVHSQIMSCGCLRESKGEYKIKNLLKLANVSFIQEKTFNTCRFNDTNRLAKFDFYVDNKYLIEYDGIQHFEYRDSGWNTKENLKITQERDTYKDQWCKENNIPLIRIPYTHLKNLCIEDLRLETSKFIMK